MFVCFTTNHTGLAMCFSLTRLATKGSYLRTRAMDSTPGGSPSHLPQVPPVFAQKLDFAQKPDCNLAAPLSVSPSWGRIGIIFFVQLCFLTGRAFRRATVFSQTGAIPDNRVFLRRKPCSEVCPGYCRAEFAVHPRIQEVCDLFVATLKGVVPGSFWILNATYRNEILFGTAVVVITHPIGGPPVFAYCHCPEDNAMLHIAGESLYYSGPLVVKAVFHKKGWGLRQRARGDSSKRTVRQRA